MPSSLDIILQRFEKDILELGFETSEKDFDDMKRCSLDYQRQIRQGQNPDGRARKIYILYKSMIFLEGNTDFLENRYPDY